MASLILYPSKNNFNIQKFPISADFVDLEILSIKITILIIYYLLELNKIKRSCVLMKNHLVKEWLIIKKHCRSLAYCSVID